MQKTAIEKTTRDRPRLHSGARVARRDRSSGFALVRQSADAKFLLLAQLAGDLHRRVVSVAGR